MSDVRLGLFLSGGKTTNEDMEDFLNCMAISVFNRFCQNIPTMGPSAAFDPPSPLQLWQG
jgi:hypothetical protein